MGETSGSASKPTALRRCRPNPEFPPSPCRHRSIQQRAVRLDGPFGSEQDGAASHRCRSSPDPQLSRAALPHGAGHELPQRCARGLPRGTRGARTDRRATSSRANADRSSEVAAACGRRPQGSRSRGPGLVQSLPSHGARTSVQPRVSPHREPNTATLAEDRRGEDLPLTVRGCASSALCPSADVATTVRPLRGWS